ncbi:5-hydroxyisourate hydrolase-like isoform X1 [Asterias rubens]|uniref:5-hydroxyisourate hydrolase-like isoform X1 n=2 Tax=Asterias rubens TaxID=7604 RepID=UPI0014558AF6|nr:5-hydroxyisourate hydrolase-like isoform X1 [Asterias rubens]XP_033631314.1 5-hydroxyisourate hydrolase-like isoform X1 [Asterias rubens]XP_033631315.1 5-hydroxyisourate hydrolase-like isoform X1 [Asterias rubens]XP_033631316.1 5-hydroxyisourate hydrolase-like isoform X1 [Asterias rubens]
MSDSNYRIRNLIGHLQGTTQGQTVLLGLNETSSTMAGSPLTTHVLDTALGRPAQNLAIDVSYQRSESQEFDVIARGKTNSDGRAPNLLTQAQFIAGVYKIKFDTGSYFKSIQTVGFYPYVEIVFEIHNPNQHYHVPLLLSPYSYSTYRGS